MILEFRDITKDAKDPTAWGIVHVPLAEGTTLGESFEQNPQLAQLSARVMSAAINGTKTNDWKSLKPAKNDKVTLAVMPGDGVFATIFSVLSAISTLVSVVQFFISLFNPPKTPSIKRQGADPTYSFEGLRNPVTPGDAVQVQYGIHGQGGQLLMYYVDVMSRRRQEMGMLVSLGEGPIEAIKDIEINDVRATNIGSITIASRFGTSSQDVLPGFERIKNTFFDGRDFTSERVRGGESNSKVNSPGDPIIYATVNNDVRQADIQVQFPDGIGENKKSGNVKRIGVTYRVEYSPHGQQNWIKATDRTVEDKKRGALLDSYPLTFPNPDAWDIRLTWLKAPKNVTRGVDMFRTVLFNVTEHRGLCPAYSGTALLSVRALGTDQLQGGQPKLTSVVHGRTVKRYENTNSYTIGMTQSPAWNILDYMANSIYGMGTLGITEADIDLQSFLDFATLANSQTEVCTMTPGSILKTGETFCDKSAINAIEGEPIGNTTFGDDAGDIPSGYVGNYNVESFRLVSRANSISLAGICYTRICCPHGTPSAATHTTGVNSPDRWCDAPETIAQFHSSSGTPRTGLLSYVASGSNLNNLTAYGAIYDQRSSQIQIRAWVNEPVSSGTTLATVSYSVINSMWLDFIISADYGATGVDSNIDLRVSVSSGGSFAQILQHDDTPPTIPRSSGAMGIGGVIAMPVGTGVHHSAVWANYNQQCGTCYTAGAIIDFNCNDPGVDD